MRCDDLLIFRVRQTGRPRRGRSCRKSRTSVADRASDPGANAAGALVEAAKRAAGAAGAMRSLPNAGFRMATAGAVGMVVRARPMDMVLGQCGTAARVHDFGSPRSSRCVGTDGKLGNRAFVDDPARDVGRTTR